MDAIDVTKNYKERFSNLFRGLGRLDGPDYKIKMKSDAKPYTRSTPRRVPMHNIAKVKEKLTRKEEMQIMFKLDETTK